ncbi:MAG: hypothetical protein EHM49_01230 [Deltaproteobacteria bacterium]|nr:MAG: hypothetical protein EHM49_01230 [Deltaproteobacteria bacterium]
MEKHICIIPCRAGSKGIKDKNLLKLNHKTLVRLAVEVAMDSGIFSRVIITTDYPRPSLGIDDIGSRGFTQLIYSARPRELASDTAEMASVVKYVLDDRKGMEKWVWLLQPTSPFRTIADIKKIKTALESGDWKSCISFKPMKEQTERAYTIKDGVFYKLKYTSYKNKEDLKRKAIRSGNFYVTQRDAFLDSLTFENHPFFGYTMGGVNIETCTQDEWLWSRKMGLNIDDPEDWEAAKGIVRRGDFIL